MDLTKLMLGAAVFVSAIGLDYADASNTRAVAEGRAHAAALWSITMYALGMLGFCSVFSVSYWLALPEAAGLYIGTLLAVSPARAWRRAATSQEATSDAEVSTKRRLCAMATTARSASTPLSGARVPYPATRRSGARKSLQQITASGPKREAA